MVTTQPRKQRKQAAEAPWHVRHKRLAAHVDPDLRKKHDWKLPRAIPLRKGDQVLVARGILLALDETDPRRRAKLLGG